MEVKISVTGEGVRQEIVFAYCEQMESQSAIESAVGHARICGLWLSLLTQTC